MRIMNDFYGQVGMLTQALDKFILNQVCIQAWLGYGEALFIGFGKDLKRVKQKRELSTLCELQTHFADWLVACYSDVIGTSDDERGKAEKAIDLLRGCRVSKWAFGESPSVLEIELEKGLRLRIDSWSGEELDAEQMNTDAWCLRLPPKGDYLCVDCSGRIHSER